MDYEIYPIAITKGDLTTLIRVCENVLGYSPGRGLDQSYLNSDDPAAFLSCLALDNKPIDTLRHGRHKSNLLAHCMLSFAVVIDFDCLIQLQNTTSLSIYSKDARREHLAIVSGTADKWYDAIVCASRKDSEYSIRSLMNGIQSYLERFGFRELFITLKKQKQSDGTFILCKK